MYRAVIFEAVSDRDMNAWLNAGVLLRIWPDLFLPDRYRTLWEEHLPELADTQSGT
jgi:hypothetical protein